MGNKFANPPYVNEKGKFGKSLRFFAVVEARVQLDKLIRRREDCPGNCWLTSDTLSSNVRFSKEPRDVLTLAAPACPLHQIVDVGDQIVTYGIREAQSPAEEMAVALVKRVVRGLETTGRSPHIEPTELDALNNAYLSEVLADVL